MVVIAVIAILASVALPSFKDIIERNSLRQAVELLKSDMQFARTEAIKQSQNLTVSRNTGNNGAWCYGIDVGACDCGTAGDCSIKAVSGAQFGSINLTSAGANTGFSSRRGTANSSNTIFSSPNYTVKVYVSNGGRTLICSDTAGAGYPSC